MKTDVVIDMVAITSYDLSLSLSLSLSRFSFGESASRVHHRVHDRARREQAGNETRRKRHVISLFGLLPYIEFRVRTKRSLAEVIAMSRAFPDLETTEGFQVEEKSRDMIMLDN